MKVHTNRRRGFSLTEMLMAVGILAVLMAVAVPSVIHYRRELKLTELDDNARAVFVAAQNHLTALRSTSAGALVLDTDADKVGRPAKKGVKVDETQLMYVSTNVTGAEPGWLVLPGSIEGDLSGEDSCYLVEFDPVSGAVYGVFFMEKSGSQVLDESAYQKLYQYVSDGKSCRVRDGRKAFLRSEGGFYVGYYGADGTLDITRPDLQKLPTPKLTLINAEELRLDIHTDPAVGIDESKIFASVSVSDGTATETLVSEGSIQSGTVAKVVLDTLKTSGYNRALTQSTAGWTVGGTFAQWMENGGSYVITPGADVTVTVSIFYKPDGGEGIVALPQTASVTTNSLFAARAEVNTDVTVNTNPDVVKIKLDTVDVAYGRHLQNLDSNTSHLDSAITAARQVREIDFNKPGSGVYSWADTYGYAAHPFVPITNSHLDIYDGKSLAIRNLNAVKASGRYDNAGLFATFYGSDLKNIELVDAKATGTNAGALAGMARNDGILPETAAHTDRKVMVDYCHVYLTQYTNAVRIRGTSKAGGLIGMANGLYVQHGCSASTVVDGGTVGGIVGGGDDLIVARSYAAGYLTGDTVGGLVGSASRVKLMNSYAAGTIAKATQVAGGLSAGPTNDTRTSYAAVDYVDVPTSDKVYGAVPSGAFLSSGGKVAVHYLVKSGVNDGTTVTNVAPVSDPEQMRVTNLGLGTQFDNGSNSAVKAYPYNLPVDAGPRDPKLSAPYPYPTLNVGVGTNKTPISHYGDWLEAEASGLFLAYFEQYADGTYGYQYPISASEEENTLRDDKGALLNDGYAIIKKDDPKVVQIAGEDVGWTKADTFTDSQGDTLNIYILATDLAQKRHAQAPARYADDSDMPADYGGYCELTVDGDKIWFNPDFAKTTSLKQPTSVKIGAIRSIRHFNNMRRYSSDKIDLWTQELDLDGALYVGYPAADGTVAGMAVTTAADGGRRMVMDTITMVSSGASKDSWGAIYDGGGHAIRHMNIQPVTGVGSKTDDQGRTYAGLFGRTINASVKNLTVENCSVAGAKLGSKDAYTGLLVAYNEGAVENCYAVNCTATATAGYVGGLLGAARTGTIKKCGIRVESALDYDSYTVSGGQYVGGFVGYEWDGVIEHCYAAVKVSGENAGGFAGRLEGAGSIKNSYAGGHTVDGVYLTDAPNVYATTLAGGFAGKRHATKLVALENVYTTCSVGVPQKKTADVFAPEVSTVPSGFAYAGGDVVINGAVVSTADHNKAGVTVRSMYSPTGDQAAAHPYDDSLPEIYPYCPALDGDGQPLDHYGDWYQDTNTRPKREWEQQLPTSEQEELSNLTASATWTNTELKLDILIDVPGNGYDQDLDNAPVKPIETEGGSYYQGVNGIYCITTDLGYKFIFRVNADHTIDSLAGDQLKVNRVDLGIQDDGRRDIRWEISIPNEFIPPYVEYISFGSMINDDYTLTNITNGNKGVAYLGVNETIRIDDDTFDDWIGYEHQVLEGKPADGNNTPIYGHTTGSILGTKEDIFFHLISDGAKWWKEPHEGMDFQNFGVPTNGEMRAWTKDGRELPCTWWGSFRTLTYHAGQSKYTITYNCPCLKTVTNEWWSGTQWTNQPIDVAELHVSFDPETKHQEYEMRIDLGAWMTINLYENQLLDDLDAALEEGAREAKNVDLVKWDWAGGNVELTATRDLSD